MTVSACDLPMPGLPGNAAWPARPVRDARLGEWLLNQCMRRLPLPSSAAAQRMRERRPEVRARRQWSADVAQTSDVAHDTDAAMGRHQPHLPGLTVDATILAR